MSMRNKRIKKELIQLIKYNVVLEDNWETKEDIHIIFVYKTEKLSMIINNKYPFVPPKLYVNKDDMRIDYIDWFLRDKKNYEEIKNVFNIKVPCICCTTISCLWAPTMNIENVIKEFIEYYEEYNKLKQMKEIYNKIPKFDNLIYNHIFEFLY